MSRLSRKERKAKADHIAARADLIVSNQATPARRCTEGLDRELRLLAGVGKLGSGYMSPAMLKQHSKSRGCAAPLSGHGQKPSDHLGLVALIGRVRTPKPQRPKGLKVWSEPVPQDKLPRMVAAGQIVMAERADYIRALDHQSALALYQAETVEGAHVDAVSAIRVVEALACLVRPRRKSRGRKPKA